VLNTQFSAVMCNYYFLKTVKIHIAILLSLTALLSCNQSSKNHKEDLIQLKKKMQKKLDTGENMMLTDRQYMFDTDSVLELIYNELIVAKPELSKQLVIEQQEWNSKKKQLTDSLWKPVDRIFEETGITPQLEREIAYGTIAELNYDRAMELNNRLNEKK
jgi:hypothetical protein